MSLPPSLAKTALSRLASWPTASPRRPVPTCASTATTRSTGTPGGRRPSARAREEDRPILLSVGYSACHWCHVMEHESFEDAETAAYMNEHFVNVKVDREERPDVDAIYMEAMQAISGQGGWPLTVFLDPDGVPFYGGTYFPPDEGRGMPSFQHGDGSRRRRLRAQARRDPRAGPSRRERGSAPIGPIEPAPGRRRPPLLDEAVERLRRRRRHGARRASAARPSSRRPRRSSCCWRPDRRRRDRPCERQPRSTR